MIPTIFCLAGIGLCINKHYWWGAFCLFIAFFGFLVTS